MHNAIPNSFVNSAPIAILAFCAVSVGFFLWFLISLLFDGRKGRKRRVRVLPLRNLTPILTIQTNGQETRATVNALEIDNRTPILPIAKQTGTRLRSDSY
jgi:hypothetical protein